MSTLACEALLRSLETPESQILPTLASLSSADLAPLVPLLLSWLGYYLLGSGEAHTVARERKSLSNEVRGQLSDLLVSRLSAAPPSKLDPLVAEIHTALYTPSLTCQSATSKSALLDWRGILLILPKECMEPYRDALMRIIRTPSAEETACDLPIRSRYHLEFLDAFQARAPHSKLDELALRSLELVQMPEEMGPLIPGVLEWICDMNWPVAPGCWDQLARFPELTVDPIRAVLRRGDDGEWAINVLDFLRLVVPRPLMERARPEIERIAQRPTQEEIDFLTMDSAIECLKEMDLWAARMKILSRQLNH
ncbi:hypothetical protein C8R45DRAFT_878836 [Mycena sanguinolenta]|nr:hypothetical protein C8R45DRAFT_878836 [Mycena sanguinolenta]